MPKDERMRPHRVAQPAAPRANAVRCEVEIPEIPESYFPITSREDLQRKLSAVLGEHRPLVGGTAVKFHPTSVRAPLMALRDADERRADS